MNRFQATPTTRGVELLTLRRTPSRSISTALALNFLITPVLIVLAGCGKAMPTSTRNPEATTAVDTLAMVTKQESRTHRFLNWHRTMTPFVQGDPGSYRFDLDGFTRAIEHTNPDVVAYLRGAGPTTPDAEIVSGLVKSIEIGNKIGASVPGERSNSFAVRPGARTAGIYRVVNWGGIGALFTNPEAQRVIDLIDNAAAYSTLLSLLTGPYGVLARFVAAVLTVWKASLQYLLNRYSGYFIYCTWWGQLYLSRP